ncbi:MAG: RES family NAD+ phosphorylase [Truepera sp.]|nr:RES family NAD+ phosphorylase [Truepera sp.]
MRIVYASDSIALAALERLVHTRSVKGLEGLWVYSFTFEEEESTFLPNAALPLDWNRKPVPPDWHAQPLKATQLIGNNWSERRASLVLRVPSAIIPSQFSYLINPLHPTFDAFRIGAPQRFHFDERIATLVAVGERGS